MPQGNHLDALEGDRKGQHSLRINDQWRVCFTWKDGERAITADTALRLGKYFGVSPELWLDLQSDFELRVARQTIWPTVASSVKTRVA